MKNRNISEQMNAHALPSTGTWRNTFGPTSSRNSWTSKMSATCQICWIWRDTSTMLSIPWSQSCSRKFGRYRIYCISVEVAQQPGPVACDSMWKYVWKVVRQMPAFISHGHAIRSQPKISKYTYKNRNKENMPAKSFIGENLTILNYIPE